MSSDIAASNETAHVILALLELIEQLQEDIEAARAKTTEASNRYHAHEGKYSVWSNSQERQRMRVDEASREGDIWAKEAHALYAGLRQARDAESEVELDREAVIRTLELYRKKGE